MRSTIFAFWFAGCVSVSQLQIFAQTPAPARPAASVARVEVANVKFNAVRAVDEIWMEAEIELDVKPGGKMVSGEYVDRVRTTLNVMFEATDNAGQKLKRFYRSSSEAISIEGGKATVRFYLPPELVKRDRLRTDVKYYTVDLEAGGEPQPPTKNSVSADLKGAESVKNFQAMLFSESRANEGLLMPQHLTPFAYDSQRPSPTILRREPQR